MRKAIVLVLAVVGAGFLITRCSPSAFAAGPHLAGHLVSYGFIVLALVVVMALGLKSK